MRTALMILCVVVSISADDGFLFTAGTDGVLAVFEIKERDGRLAKRLVL